MALFDAMRAMLRAHTLFAARAISDNTPHAIYAMPSSLLLITRLLLRRLPYICHTYGC